MRTYEVMFIVNPNATDEEQQKLIALLETAVNDRGGKITKVDNWGRRKLAYPIKKFEDGIYIILYIEGTGREIAEVERRLRVTDLALRHITVRTDEDLRRAEKIKSRRKVTAAGAPGAGDDDFDDDDDDDFDR
ncbi:MAG: 30S ribosomal protein S6 [Blastocatellia bacterium]